MNRREALVVTGGLALSVSPAPAATTVLSNKIVIQSPFDAIVTYGANSGPVKSGDKLFELRSFELEHFDIQLAMHEQHLDILERPFKDGRVDDDIGLAKDN
jgi:hypothetical protein